MTCMIWNDICSFFFFFFSDAFDFELGMIIVRISQGFDITQVLQVQGMWWLSSQIILHIYGSYMLSTGKHHYLVLEIVPTPVISTVPHCFCSFNTSQNPCWSRCPLVVTGGQPSHANEFCTTGNWTPKALVAQAQAKAVKSCMEQPVPPARFLPALSTSSSLCLPEISGADGNQEAVLSVSPL